MAIRLRLHCDSGEESLVILDNFAEKLAEIAVIDKPAKFEGRSMIMFLTQKR